MAPVIALVAANPVVALMGTFGCLMGLSVIMCWR